MKTSMRIHQNAFKSIRVKFTENEQKTLDSYSVKTATLAAGLGSNGVVFASLRVLRRARHELEPRISAYLRTFPERANLAFVFAWRRYDCLSVVSPSVCARVAGRRA